MLAGAFALALATLASADGAGPSAPRASGPAPFAPSAATTADGRPIAASSLGGSDYCGACHTDVFQQWAASAHHFSSFNNPFYRRVAVETGRRKGPAAARWCAGCHDPVPLLAGLVGSLDLEGFAANAGITCLVCHRVVHARPDNGGYVLARPLLGPEAVAERPLVRALHDGLTRAAPWLHRATLARPASRTPAFCGACHSQVIPAELNGAGPFPVQDDYGRWLASRHSEGAGAGAGGDAAGCADCHMPLVPSDDPAADGGLVRSHAFAAANTALPALNRDDAHLAAVQAFLAGGGVALELAALRHEGGTRVALAGGRGSVEPGEPVEIEVTVESRRVGHAFPGGAVAFNEAWLELVVEEAGGRVLLGSGRMGDGGEVEGDAVFYGASFADRDGQPVDERRVSSDAAALRAARLVPAGGADVARYRLLVPRDARGPLDVRARLNWRKFSPAFTRWVFEGRPVRPLPVTVVAEARLRLEVGARGARDAGRPARPAGEGGSR